MLKKSATDALKTSSKGVIQTTAAATGYFIGNKITNKITRVSKNPQQNNLDTVTDKNDNEIQRQEINERTEIKIV